MDTGARFVIGVAGGAGKSYLCGILVDLFHTKGVSTFLSFEDARVALGNEKDRVIIRDNVASEDEREWFRDHDWTILLVIGEEKGGDLNPCYFHPSQKEAWETQAEVVVSSIAWLMSQEKAE